jgi:hypothetical protein
MVLHYAFQRHWQFGRDIVFTFGPYGFVYTRMFDPDTYWLTLSAWIAIALLIGAAVSSLLDGRHKLAAIPAIAVLYLSLRVSPDAPFLMLPLLYAVMSFWQREKVGTCLAAGLLLACAFTASIKFSYALLSVEMLLVVELSRIIRKKFVPWHLFGFVTGVGIFFIAAGQKMANLSVYLSRSLELARNYSEMMQLSGPAAELVLFLAMAAAFIILVIAAEMHRLRQRPMDLTGLLFIGVNALYVFAIFKTGFVRQDGGHVVMGWAGLGACSALLYLLYYRDGQLRRGWLLLLLLISVASAGYGTMRFNEEWPNDGMVADSRDRIFAVRQVIAGELFNDLSQRYRTALAGIREDNPLSPVSGSVDIYPWEQATVLAHNLEYRPRPVFQSYAVYSESLNSLNRDYLKNGHGPENLIFEVKTFDARFPSLDDSLSWPEVLAGYDLIPGERERLLLRKRSVPRRLGFGAPISIIANWRAPVHVPEFRHPVWVQIATEKTVVGQLATTLFKLPSISMIVTLATGEERRYRLIPSMAAAGFLLSPVIESAEDFAQLFEGATQFPAGSRIVSIRLSGESGLRWCYRDRVRIVFRDMEIDGQ